MSCAHCVFWQTSEENKHIRHWWEIKKDKLYMGLCHKFPHPIKTDALNYCDHLKLVYPQRLQQYSESYTESNDLYYTERRSRINLQKLLTKRNKEIKKLKLIIKGN
jgi:hypothetical protein